MKLVKPIHICAVFLGTLTSVARAETSPWNGAWALDAERSTKGASEFAAPGYVFNVMPDGRIKWEIPAIGEVVIGRTDGHPMAVYRKKPAPGMTLSVQADGPLTFRYQVERNGVAEGAGLMRIVEDGKAWVDLSWRVGQPERAGALVYTRQPAQ